MVDDGTHGAELRYVNQKGSVVLPGLYSPDRDGNATLQFSEAGSAEWITRKLNLFPGKAQKIATDPTFSITVDPRTGLLGGTVQAPGRGRTKWQGILYQKGAISGGFGYFLTAKKKGEPSESGAVTLTADARAE